MGQAGGRSGRRSRRRDAGGVLLAPAQPSRIAPHGRTAIVNYSGDAGAGSHIITNISESPTWRAALLGTVAAGALCFGGRAYAACVGAGGTYSCSDALTTTQTLTGTPLTVTTTPGFSIVTVAGDAFTLTGTGGLSFTDDYFSTIAGAINGISAINDISGLLTITTTGAVTGGNTGIFARNNGTGALEIVANGDVTRRRWPRHF